MLRRGLPGWTGQSLKQGGRVVGHHTEAFVGIDTSKLRNAVAIADSGRNNGSSPSGRDLLRRRLGEIADELQQTHRELDAKRELIKAQPTLGAKQPHSRAAMKVVERLRDLYDEAGEILRKLDPATLLPFVSRPIVGTEFREVLAAIWGHDMTIDGMPLFPPGWASEAGGDRVE